MEVTHTIQVRPKSEYDSVLEFLKEWEEDGVLQIQNTCTKDCSITFEFLVDVLSSERQSFWNQFDYVFMSRLEEGPVAKLSK